MDSILIIDDEPQIRKLLSRMMELEGYEVFQAADCQSTLKQLKLHNPQVVLCDVFLPDGNGVDMVTTIKKLYPELEVILLTAHGTFRMVCRQSRMEPLIISPKGMIIIKLFR